MSLEKFTSKMLGDELFPHFDRDSGYKRCSFFFENVCSVHKGNFSRGIQECDWFCWNLSSRQQVLIEFITSSECKYYTSDCRI